MESNESRIERIIRQNEELKRRHQEVLRDKLEAERRNASVTKQRVSTKLSDMMPAERNAFLNQPKSTNEARGDFKIILENKDRRNDDFQRLPQNKGRGERRHNRQTNNQHNNQWNDHERNVFNHRGNQRQPVETRMPQPLMQQRVAKSTYSCSSDDGCDDFFTDIATLDPTLPVDPDLPSDVEDAPLWTASSHPPQASTAVNHPTGPAYASQYTEEVSSSPQELPSYVFTRLQPQPTPSSYVSDNDANHCYMNEYPQAVPNQQGPMPNSSTAIYQEEVRRTSGQNSVARGSNNVQHGFNLSQMDRNPQQMTSASTTEVQSGGYTQGMSVSQIEQYLAQGSAEVQMFAKKLSQVAAGSSQREVLPQVDGNFQQKSMTDGSGRVLQQVSNNYQQILMAGNGGMQMVMPEMVENREISMGIQESLQQGSFQQAHSGILMNSGRMQTVSPQMVRNSQQIVMPDSGMNSGRMQVVVPQMTGNSQQVPMPDGGYSMNSGRMQVVVPQMAGNSQQVSMPDGRILMNGRMQIVVPQMNDGSLHTVMPDGGILINSGRLQTVVPQIASNLQNASMHDGGILVNSSRIQVAPQQMVGNTQQTVLSNGGILMNSGRIQTVSPQVVRNSQQMVMPDGGISMNTGRMAPQQQASMSDREVLMNSCRLQTVSPQVIRNSQQVMPDSGIIMNSSRMAPQRDSIPQQTTMPNRELSMNSGRLQTVIRNSQPDSGNSMNSGRMVPQRENTSQQPGVSANRSRTLDGSFQWSSVPEHAVSLSSGSRPSSASSPREAAKAPPGLNESRQFLNGIDFSKPPPNRSITKKASESQQQYQQDSSSQEDLEHSDGSQNDAQSFAEYDTTFPSYPTVNQVVQALSTLNSESDAGYESQCLDNTGKDNGFLADEIREMWPSNSSNREPINDIPPVMSSTPYAPFRHAGTSGEVPKFRPILGRGASENKTNKSDTAGSSDSLQNSFESKPEIRKSPEKPPQKKSAIQARMEAARRDTSHKFARNVSMKGGVMEGSYKGIEVSFSNQPNESDEKPAVSDETKEKSTDNIAQKFLFACEDIRETAKKVETSKSGGIDWAADVSFDGPP